MSVFHVPCSDDGAPQRPQTLQEATVQPRQVPHLRIEQYQPRAPTYLLTYSSASRVARCPWPIGSYGVHAWRPRGTVPATDGLIR